ncbi:MAG: 2-dehydropantoate 2-reductase [Tuberibacillus sp.]
MKVGVVGGGAIGLLTAGYLSHFISVTLYVRRPDQKRRLEADGINIENGPGLIRDFAVKLSGDPWKEDIIILAVKQPDLPSLLACHQQACTPGQTLMFLQNGTQHLSMVRDLNYEHIFIGLVEHGALKKSDTEVIHKGMGQIKIGLIRGDHERVEPLLNHPAFPMLLISDWVRAVDEKLLINAIINPLTALFRVKNGELLSNSHYLNVMKMVFNEVMQVLHLKDEKAQWDRLLQIARNTAENRSSMLQDIEAGRPTENEAILGDILQRGRKRSITLSITHFLYESIRAIENGTASLRRKRKI